MNSSNAPLVAIATCAAWPDPGPGLLPLIENLQAKGIRVICLPWQSVDDRPFLDAGLILPLCAWDYAAAPEAFRHWIGSISAAGGRFANASELMLWNMDKSYLLDLAALGVPVPRTLMITDPSTGAISARMREEGWTRAVLKPAIGQSGNDVTLLDLAREGNWPPPSAGTHVLQNFQPEIAEFGETTLTFFGGVFSHAVLIVSHEDKLVEAVEAAVADLAAKGVRPLTVLKVERPVEVSQGAGLANLLDVNEGRRRLAGYAVPARIEDWAGPVAGPAEIERTFGTKRSTLHDWQKRGAVIGLLKGERKHVFPLAQFVDGRPVKGMSDVTRIIGNPRAAWQWLIQPKPSIGGTPLDRLKAEKIDEVVAAAEHDFG